MGQRIALSPVDIAKIKALYNCSDPTFKKPDIGPFKSIKIKEPNYQNGIMNDGRYNVKIVRNNHQLPLTSRIRYQSTPFKNFEDFMTRTGMKQIPPGFHFEFQNKLPSNANEKSSFKMYPSIADSNQNSKPGLRCSHFAAENCLDQFRVS